MSDSTCTAPLPLRLEASDDRPCHDKAAREIIRQARKRALICRTLDVLDGYEAREESADTVAVPPVA